MESTNLGYSAKNIPVCSKNMYLKELINKSEHFIKRLRWKVYHFLNKPNNVENVKNFGFNSMNSPPKNPLIYEFENDMYNMIQNIQFKNVKNNFQSKMQLDLKSIKDSGKIYVKADKTHNMYAVEPKEYDKLLSDNITKLYKKSNPREVYKVNVEAEEIVDKLNLSDRVQVLTNNSAFVTIKDHKPGFPNKIACRLLNPSKSHVGKISKEYLETINASIREKTKFHQWRNTNTVIDWFNKITEKPQSSFVKFDIVSFYPSINMGLVKRALNFAKRYTTITKTITDTILNARKSFLFYNENPWIKKDTNNHFDVTEGSFDGAEVCELVGLFMLHKLQHLFNNGSSVGIYRDDGLAVVRNLSGPQQDRLRKNVIQLFKSEGLQITIDINLHTVDFLDVQFDLPNNKYFPYKKPNETPIYINKSSNHPPNILKQIPSMTAERLSKLSCNEEEFKKVAPEYEQFLKSSGYNDKLAYNPDKTQKKKQRKRNIMWFNPPYDLQVETNVGRSFLTLVEKHFPRHHKLNKIINKNNVKVSYSCMPNISSHISSHNIATLNKSKPTEQVNPDALCNCNNKALCPLNGECQIRTIIYNGKLKIPERDDENYVGLVEPDFKGRYNDHISSFNHRKYSNKTELSKEYWKAIDSGCNIGNRNVKFSVLKKCQPYRIGAKKCDLCLSEKLIIMQSEESVINKRDEFISKCRHTNKFMLRNFKSKFK